jgi:hypothetical protein
MLRIHGNLGLVIPGDDSIGPNEDSYLITHYWVFSVMIDNLTIWQFDDFRAEDIWHSAVAIF